MSNSQLTRVQILKIGTFMEPLLEKDKAGYVAYKDGWDDLKIAQKFQVTEANIIRLRKDLFGKISPSAGGTPMTKIWDRLAQLEARITELEARQRPSLSDRYNINTGPNGLSVTAKT